MAIKDKAVKSSVGHVGTNVTHLSYEPVRTAVLNPENESGNVTYCMCESDFC